VIELSPGQDLPLTDAEGRPLGRVVVGLGWDHEHTAGFAGSGAPGVDLDASAVQFTGGKLFDLAFYNNRATRDGSVVHAGDNRSGRGEGDDETIEVDLARVHGPVDAIGFMVSSYHGQTLEYVGGAYVRVCDDGGRELGRLTITLGVRATGLAMAVLRRSPDGWVLHAVGEGIAATKPTESWSALVPFL